MAAPERARFGVTWFGVRNTRHAGRSFKCRTGARGTDTYGTDACGTNARGIGVCGIGICLTGVPQPIPTQLREDVTQHY